MENALALGGRRKLCSNVHRMPVAIRSGISAAVAVKLFEL